MKKPETTPSAASPLPGSSCRSTGEAEEHLPWPSSEKELQVQPRSEESERPGRPGSALAPTARQPGSPGLEISSMTYQRTSELTSQLRFISCSFQRNNSIIMTVNGHFRLIGTMRETGLNIRSKQMQPFVFPAGNLEGVTPFSQELGMLIGNTLMIR